ncbi:MAG: hypothetical protein Q8N63_09255 [Nanoarchaeota archaeon]|nr:hypothetical protein [Nanoarchaeota archaeon]
MNVKSVFYKDKKGREVLYVPLVCVIINKREPEVILEPARLKRRQIDWDKGKTSVERIVSYLEVEQEDIEAITGLCFENRITEAKSYCVDTFDQIVNRSNRLYTE